ncbi:MAG: bis(5'-nucleosyl)-tetraphosphatase (symmetrical) YqeK [Firmicutes bacterium]|nr:bis(5'-nucleosyl)-tetraphosphatase (symmetrical) YqeK [Candidatus Fermentithermobacillaceae bacterium]
MRDERPYCSQLVYEKSMRPDKLEFLSRYLGRDKIEHCMRVAASAREIASRFGADPERAELAGLLHDVARDLAPEEILRLAVEHGIMVTQVGRASPVVLHGGVGAALARSELGVDDEEVLMAISSHVTGRRGWTRLEQVVYLADKVEPGRSYPGVEQIRNMLAAGDFRGALRQALIASVSYCSEAGCPVDPETVVVLGELSRLE